MACEVLIVGGGLVGASLAIALSRSGVDAILVEARSPATSLTDPERERYLALSRASVNALNALGAWPALDSHAASIRSVHVSRRGDFGRVLLRAEEHAVDRFGAVVPASRLGQALEAALGECTGLRRLSPATLRAFQSSAEGIEARIDVNGDASSTTVRASLLVGADGADSFVRDHAGLLAEREDYGQDAMVLSIGISRDHGGVAYERFTDHGAMAALPLPGRRMGLVWTLAREHADAIAALPESERIEHMQRVFGQRLGRFHAPGRLVRYPLGRSFAERTHRDRVVVVGNAAQSLHPVAAQGFNLGLRDALVLAEEIAAVLSTHAMPSGQGPDTGDLRRLPAEHVQAALRRYAERRRADRQRIAALSHALARWPKVRAPGAGVFRSLAFGLMNAAPALRQSLVLAAMGFTDDAPASALEAA